MKAVVNDPTLVRPTRWQISATDRSVVRSSDATGLANPAVYGALARKGLVQPGPRGLPILTAAGLAYETGLADRILHRPDH